MMRFFREQKFLAVLLVVSSLVVLIGIIMVYYNNKKLMEAAVAAAEAKQVQNTINTMGVIANLAEQQLQESVSTAAPETPLNDIKPQESLDRVAALNGRIPDVGSDDWCEIMMVKDSNAWTKEEQATFAEHCIH